MIYRDISEKILQSAEYFQVVALLGPRQSGKTTLARLLFNKHAYVSFEDLDMRLRASADPRNFLSEYPNEFGLILDEIQHVPELLSYMQTIVDNEKRNGFFIITASQNILVNQAVTQTLAGRVALLTLFPLSINEMKNAQVLPDALEQAIFNGCYPRIYSDNSLPESTYKYYISSYIERDVRDVKKITDLHKFQHFLQLCAGRIGQLVNFSSLGNDLGIDNTTIRSWISVLEASYGIFLLYPYYKNFGKRVTKSPKLFFVDTGIACSLLNIRSAEELALHHMRGHLIENFLISDFFKQYHNLDRRPSIYFWRDHQGNEIDCVLEGALFSKLIEIRGGKTLNSDYFKQFAKWQKMAEISTKNYLIYTGPDYARSDGTQALNWKSTGNIVL